MIVAKCQSWFNTLLHEIDDLILTMNITKVLPSYCLGVLQLSQFSVFYRS